MSLTDPKTLAAGQNSRPGLCLRTSQLVESDVLAFAVSVARRNQQLDEGKLRARKDAQAKGQPVPGWSWSDLDLDGRTLDDLKLAYALSLVVKSQASELVIDEVLQLTRPVIVHHHCAIRCTGGGAYRRPSRSGKRTTNQPSGLYAVGDRWREHDAVIWFRSVAVRLDLFVRPAVGCGFGVRLGICHSSVIERLHVAGDGDGAVKAGVLLEASDNVDVRLLQVSGVAGAGVMAWACNGSRLVGATVQQIGADGFRIFGGRWPQDLGPQTIPGHGSKEGSGFTLRDCQSDQCGGRAISLQATAGVLIAGFRSEGANTAQPATADFLLHGARSITFRDISRCGDKGHSFEMKGRCFGIVLDQIRGATARVPGVQMGWYRDERGGWTALDWLDRRVITGLTTVRATTNKRPATYLGGAKRDLHKAAEKGQALVRLPRPDAMT